MITIIYETGNDYFCCCRQTETDTLDVETEQEAIEECIRIDKQNKWDFSIDRVIGGVDSLEEDINKAIHFAEKNWKIQYKIDVLEKQNGIDIKWINDIQSEKNRRNQSIEERNIEINELKNKLIKQNQDKYII